MDAGDFVVRTEHRLEPAAAGQTTIVYRTEITGAAAGQVGPELGPTAHRPTSRGGGRAGPAGGGG